MAIYIKDLNGQRIEVTNFQEALAQTKMYVKWHEEAKAANAENQDVLYFQKAHQEWQHTLNQLEKLQPKPTHDEKD